MYPAPGTDSAPDDRLGDLGDLARALGGDETSFTGDLLRLIAKAQANPARFDALCAAFPREAHAWQLWMTTRPVPTRTELLAALDDVPANTDPAGALIDAFVLASVLDAWPVSPVAAPFYAGWVFAELRAKGWTLARVDTSPPALATAAAAGALYDGLPDVEDPGPGQLPPHPGLPPNGHGPGART